MPREIRRCKENQRMAFTVENGKVVGVVQICEACRRWKNPHAIGTRLTPSGKMKCPKCCAEKKPFRVKFLEIRSKGAAT